MREGGKILIYGHHLLLLMEVVAGGDAHVGRPMPLHAYTDSMVIVSDLAWFRTVMSQIGFASRLCGAGCSKPAPAAQLAQHSRTSGAGSNEPSPLVRLKNLVLYFAAG